MYLHDVLEIFRACDAQEVDARLVQQCKLTPEVSVHLPAIPRVR